ncbi:MAG: hypothetical protein NT123_19715 [Proteobacteria bacterium]|nr:hypothetical protein [Pseudomonadota bacterium]
MNKYQGIMLLVGAINLLLILSFPPYDYVSVHTNAPNFDGFLFVFGDHPNRTLNSNFLAIEIFTVLINAAIGWLLLRSRGRMRRRLDRQHLMLLGVALNLLLALLFPPFQDHYVATKALLPSFDGFYFVFGDNSRRVIVAAMLWVEVVFILFNGALLWLFFCQSGPQEVKVAERFATPGDAHRAQVRKKGEA